MMNKLSKGRYEAVSAGSQPAGYVHPLAIQTLKDLGYQTEGLRSKSWEEFKGTHFDLFVTVCDRAREACPNWPGGPESLHWGFDDPAEAKGSEEQKLVAFRAVASEIQQRIALFLSVEAKLPLKDNTIGGES